MPPHQPETAVVVLSGGQDSVTSLYWARERFATIHALTFHYHQRHAVEIEAAKKIGQLAGVASHAVVELPPLPASGLVPDAEGERKAVDASGGYLGLPSTFTPGRNAIFLTYAAMQAFSHGSHHLVTGVCQTDFSGYPDCRRTFIDKLQVALNDGMAWPFFIHTPLMYLTKAETVKLARTLPGAWEALALSVTCYHGQIPGCGECPACELRHKGFAEAGEVDPAREVDPALQQRQYEDSTTFGRMMGRH